MPQASTQEFERLLLRVHTFLAGVPLHDVWSVDLPRWRAGVTLDDFLRTTGNCKLDTCGCSKSSSIAATSRINCIVDAEGLLFFKQELAHFSNDQRFVHYEHVVVSVMQFDDSRVLHA